ncbi:DUF1127 domain-containing protein [Defluviimonas sp. WL0002]|uniref:DUF1127 domain-containing protein n=1 Tax=Albidovulum marisflavi TaxID=2984159 RepID=A0ABT2ZHD5_9RHOB|nr:DUF1127 domain-containing protein [Defluviimonas sp. WL0002]MCV2870521.1 DUF1127 domain-containing protein [Defluviimonas sp. WL0002]
MTQLAKTAHALPRAIGLVARAVTRIVKFVVTASQRAKARRDLARLDDHLLRDIGIDQMTAQAECSRRFWQG